MKKNFIKSVFEWVKGLFKKSKKKSLVQLYEESNPIINHRKTTGRGQYFKNNRKRTTGRTLQYIHMANGRTKVLRHETV
jgi:hypothetical protein